MDTGPDCNGEFLWRTILSIARTVTFAAVLLAVVVVYVL
jgi:hypothetical protein